MKKCYCRLSWYVLIVMVLTIFIGLRQTTVLAEEQPARAERAVLVVTDKQVVRVVALFDVQAEAV